MAYTRAWDNALPLGTVLDANDIDGEFRRLKTDIFERMNTLCTNWLADPIVLTASQTTPTFYGLATFRNLANTSNNLIIKDGGVIVTQGVVSSTASIPAGSIVMGEGIGIGLYGDSISGNQYLIGWNNDGTSEHIWIGAGVMAKLGMFGSQAAAASRNGIIAADAVTPGKLVFFANGQRFYVTGTAF